MAEAAQESSSEFAMEANGESRRESSEVNLAGGNDRVSPMSTKVPPDQTPEADASEGKDIKDALVVGSGLSVKNSEMNTTTEAEETKEMEDSTAAETPVEAEERALKLREEIRALVAERFSLREGLKRVIFSLRSEEKARRLVMSAPDQANKERSKNSGTHGPTQQQTGSDRIASETAVATPGELSVAVDPAVDGTEGNREAPVEEHLQGVMVEAASPGGSARKRPREELETGKAATAIEGLPSTVSEMDDKAGNVPNIAVPEALPKDTEIVEEATDDKHLDKKMRVEIDDRMKRRSKNLFGHLMGHLQKAKENLEKEKDTKQAERQQETELRVKEKIEKERRQHVECKIQALKDSEQDLRARLKTIQTKIEQKELSALVCHLESHYKSMQNFIRTKADPTIFWKPKVASPATDLLQKQTALEIESKIRSISRNLQPATL